MSENNENNKKIWKEIEKDKFPSDKSLFDMSQADILRLANKKDSLREQIKQKEDKIKLEKARNDLAEDFTGCYYCAKYTNQYRNKEKKFICNNCYGDETIKITEEIKIEDSELDLAEVDQELYEDTKIQLSNQLKENQIIQDELLMTLNSTFSQILEFDYKNLEILNCIARLRDRLSMLMVPTSYDEFKTFLNYGVHQIEEVCQNFINRENKINFKQVE